MKKEGKREPGDKPQYIVVEGPIGVGKTSLVKLLAQEFNARCFFEKAEENPFLEKFYQERDRYAFKAQLFFLLNRYEQQKEMWQLDLFQQSTLCDYLFAKDRIFAYLNLKEDELKLYEHFYSLLAERIAKPDLVIFLQADLETLKRRIRKRNRASEQYLTDDYLNNVIEAYNNYFFYYKETSLLVVNTAEIDFVKHHQDFNQLVREIKSVKKGTWHYIPLGSR